MPHLVGFCLPKTADIQMEQMYIFGFWCKVILKLSRGKGKDIRMPDCYTHTFLATQALMRSGQIVASQPAFMAGANGPDPMYAYRFWRRQPAPDLPALAEKMHQQHTGLFLSTMIQQAMTPVQQSYTLGFLTHYAVDCVLNPYIEAMYKAGAPYCIKNGREWLRSALDSYLYHRNYRTRLIPPQAGVPVLITDELAQVSNLLRNTILRVYDVRLPAVALADTFHDNLKLHKLCHSRFAVKKFLSPILQPIAVGNSKYIKLRPKMQPGPPLKKMPSRWGNPYTGETREQTLDEVLMESQEAAAICVTAAMRFWLGKIDSSQLEIVLGNNSYFTGVPIREAYEPEGEHGKRAEQDDNVDKAAL